MKIIIKSKNLELSPALEGFINEKINSLEKFLQIFKNKNYYGDFFGKGKPKAEVWVEIEKNTHHKKGEIFRAEIQMRLPGKSLRAEATSADLKLSINGIKDEMQRELKEYKEKMKGFN